MFALFPLSLSPSHGHTHFVMHVHCHLFKSFLLRTHPSVGSFSYLFPHLCPIPSDFLSFPPSPRLIYPSLSPSLAHFLSLCSVLTALFSFFFSIFFSANNGRVVQRDPQAPVSFTPLSSPFPLPVTLSFISLCLSLFESLYGGANYTHGSHVTCSHGDCTVAL